MKNILLLLFFAPLFTFAQLDPNAFYVSAGGGTGVCVQNGALLHIQGTLTNNAEIGTDGVIEIKGDIDNTNGVKFYPLSPSSGTEKVVKFIGNGTQTIRGDFSSAGTSNFYNLVIDKGTTGTYVQLENNAWVEGSLVFGSATSSVAYTPTATSLLTNNSNKGVIRTYDASNIDHELFVYNPSVDAIKGYPALGINRSTNFTDSYVQTRGARAVGVGGLKRRVNHTGSAVTDAYVYPVGTATKGFQAVRINFSSINSGTDDVRGMFCNGTSNASGYVGHVSQFCIGCNQGYSGLPDNGGINVIFGNSAVGALPNPCAGPGHLQQWVILEDGIKDHGYWSFKSNDVSNNSTYSLETFPRSFTEEGFQEPFNSEETWRTMHFKGDVSIDPSVASANWNTDAFAISNMSDFATYTRNAGCYGFTKPGVPGGVYTGFSHFAIKKSKSHNALPVELIYLKAEPVNNQFIQVSWSTAVEVNNSGFQVLRSTDGINFDNIGWVDGHNNSTITQTYSFDDHTAVANVVYYYKLNQVDNDGHSEETYIVNAMITGSDVFSISEFIPNPAKDLSRIVVNTSLAQTIDVKMFDMLGRELSNNTHNLNVGENTLYFDTDLLADATYTAVITTGNKVYSKKLVVSKH